MVKHAVFFSIMMVFSVLPLMAGEPMNVGMIQLEPLAYKDTDERIKGILPEITQNIQAESGIECSIALLPWKRLVMYLDDAEIDFSFGPFEDYPDKIVRIAPIYQVRYMLLHRKGTQLSSLDDLKDLKRSVGYTRGSIQVKENLKPMGIDCYDVTNYENGIRLLYAERIDTLLVSDIFSFFFLNHYGMKDKIVFPGYVVSTTDIWLVISKKSRFNTPALRQKLKTSVERLRERGIIQKITEKYVGEGWSQ